MSERGKRSTLVNIWQTGFQGKRAYLSGGDWRPTATLRGGRDAALNGVDRHCTRADSGGHRFVY